MGAAHELASSNKMDIEESEGITSSLDAPDLLDLLSDNPTSSTLTAMDEVKPKASKKINSQKPKVFHVSDIQRYSILKFYLSDTDRHTRY